MAGWKPTSSSTPASNCPISPTFVLLADHRGAEALRAYYRRYVALAEAHGLGLILDTPTWRASPDWGARLGYSPARLEDDHRGGHRVSRPPGRRARRCRC